MPEISVQHQCASISDLVEVESFGEPIGPLPLQTDKGFFEQGNLFAGTWECEPGTLSLDLDVIEVELDGIIGDRHHSFTRTCREGDKQAEGLLRDRTLICAPARG
jgi:hypothetical protein